MVWKSLGLIVPEFEWKTFPTPSEWGLVYRISFHFVNPFTNNVLSKILVREAFGEDGINLEYTTRSATVYPKEEYSIIQLPNTFAEQELSGMSRYIQVHRIFKSKYERDIITDPHYEVGIEELEQSTEPVNQQMDRIESKVDRLIQ